MRKLSTFSLARARADLPALSVLLVALASSVVLTLAGCASTAGIPASAAKPVTPATLGVADPASAAPISADWWTGFGDDTLSALITQALDGNPNLRVAQARLARMQAGSDITRSLNGPQVNASAEAMRQHYTANGLVPAPVAGSMRDTATVQLNASWELDFFGRNRAALEAAIGTERAAEADVQAARVLLSTNVAHAYLQLARAVELREVARRALAQREETLALIQQRVAAGLDTNVELRQGESLVPETRVALEAIDEQVVLLRHALAVLTAQGPQALDALTPELKTVQAVPLPASVPADLLGRRADISAARWRVEAANSDVAVARAQFYPNVNLVAFAGVSSMGLDRLFKASSEQYGIGPAIRLPIFDSGRLRANLRGKRADLDIAIESYNATVIDALRDVSDQIASLQSIARQQAEQARAQVASESAYDLAVQRYRAGLGTYLTVLNAETNVLTQRRNTTDLKTRAIDTQVSLIRALGGGYSTPDTQIATAER